MTSVWWRNMAPSVHASSILSMIRQSWRYCFDSVDKHGHIFLSHLQSGAIRSWLGLRNLGSAFLKVECSLELQMSVTLGRASLPVILLLRVWTERNSFSCCQQSSHQLQLRLSKTARLPCEVWRKCYWGRMSRLERGKSGFTMGVAHPPYMRISEEGHTGVRHVTSTHRDMCTCQSWYTTCFSFPMRRVIHEREIERRACIREGKEDRA